MNIINNNPNYLNNKQNKNINNNCYNNMKDEK